MTVSELIKELSKFDPDLQVTYEDEGQEFSPDPKLASEIWNPSLFRNGYQSPRAKPERVVL